MVNYTSLIEEGTELPDNSTIMLLNLMEKVGARNVYVAGFDGVKSGFSNYVNESFVDNRHGLTDEDTNRIVASMYKRIRKKTIDSMPIELITPSLYESNLGE